jgi:hypothetical protein
LRDLAASPAVLEPLSIQLICILAGFLLASGIRAAIRSWTDRWSSISRRVIARCAARPGCGGCRRSALPGCCFVFIEQTIAQLGGEYRLIGIAASLTGLWIAIRASALLLSDPMLAWAVAAIAWAVAALDLMGLLPATAAALDNLAIPVVLSAHGDDRDLA